MTLAPSRIFFLLGAFECFLVLVSFSTQFTRYVVGHDYLFGLLPVVESLFHVDRERNLPTLFSVFLLLCSAILLALVSALKQQSADSDRFHWTALAVGFAYLAVDEGWSFHESLIDPVGRLLGQSGHGFLYFAWVLPGILALAIFLVSYLGFMKRLPPDTLNRFLLAGSIYVGGAFGIEMIGGRVAESHGDANLYYQVLAHLEEGMEMFGVILFLYALLRHIEKYYSHIALTVGDCV